MSGSATAEDEPQQAETVISPLLLALSLTKGKQ